LSRVREEMRYDEDPDEHEIPGYGHVLTIDHGWRGVDENALAFVTVSSNGEQVETVGNNAQSDKNGCVVEKEPLRKYPGAPD
jgi:hypothetical protein